MENIRKFKKQKIGDTIFFIVADSSTTFAHIFQQIRGIENLREEIKKLFFL